MVKMSRIIISLLLTSSIVGALTLVTVNGTKITQDEVNTALMNATQGRMDQIPADKRAQFEKQVLEQLVAKELVYGDAQKTGVLESSDFKTEYGKVQERIKKELAVQVWQKQQLDKVSVSNKELKNYYDKNKEEFNEKATVHARHILVKTESEAKAIEKDLKPLTGEALKTKFIEEAKAKSTGPSGPAGGDLKYFSQGQMVPAFDKEVFSMKVGTITKPVKTEYGYHIIYLEDKKSAKKLAFTEVKSFIEKRLKMEKFKVVMQSKMMELKNKAVIK